MRTFVLYDGFASLFIVKNALSNNFYPVTQQTF